MYFSVSPHSSSVSLIAIESETELIAQRTKAIKHQQCRQQIEQSCMNWSYLNHVFDDCMLKTV